MKILERYFANMIQDVSGFRDKSDAVLMVLMLISQGIRMPSIYPFSQLI